MSQTDDVLSMLREAGEHGCTTGDFIRAYIPRFSSRIHELITRRGMEVTSEPIDPARPNGQRTYFLIGDEPDLEVGSGETAPPSAEPQSFSEPDPPAPAADPEAEPISLFDASDMELRRVGLFDVDEAA